MDKTACARTKRNISIAGRRTSLALENIFWWRLDRMAAARGVPPDKLVRQVLEDRPAGVALASALRCVVAGNGPEETAEPCRPASSAPALTGANVRHARTASGQTASERSPSSGEPERQRP